MRSEPYHWKKQTIAEDYLHHYDRVKELYAYNPWNQSVTEERAAWLDQAEHLKVDRNALCKVLSNYNKQINNAKESIEAIEALREHQTLVVVGGQQAGLFTGPLLVIYKAISIIKTAKEASQRLKRKVVPVFWIAGEDHDYEEVNHTYALNPQTDIQKIRLEHSLDKRSSISHLQIDLQYWQSAISQLDNSLIETEFKANLIQNLSRFAEQSTTLVDYFARIMAWLFGKHGLILLDSGDAEIRDLEGPMFKQLIQNHHSINAALLEGAKKVETIGYEPQANTSERQVNLFIIHEEERKLLLEHPDGFIDKNNQLFYSEAQLIDLAEASPQKFSNNLFTRPLMQEYLLPVLSTVLGPGEIAYWGLIRDAFKVNKMEMPVITPRSEFTLMEGTVQKHMKKYDISFGEVVHQFVEKKEEWLNAQDNLHLEQQFNEIKQQFGTLYDPIINTVVEMNPGLRKLGNTNKQKILEQIEFLQNRSIDAFQSQYEASLRQLERIRLSILPLGKPQERVYNVFVYLNKYGFEWMDQLIHTPMEENKLHTLVYY